eukprot:GHVU01159908.1.p1 GENE.GHVU01159908.1~~GHVU01159908.1.p1  ORF type:complete len:124 (-),score=14.46 GHVU01159908.1:150-521(-)
MSGRVGPCLTVPLCPLFCRPQAELMREMDTQLRALQLHEAEDDDKGINSDETVSGSRRSLGDPSKGVPHEQSPLHYGPSLSLSLSRHTTIYGQQGRSHARNPLSESSPPPSSRQQIGSRYTPK